MKATKIKMKPGCSNSTKTTEIDQIYIEGCTNPGYFKKATLYDYLKSNPNSINVDISRHPYRQPSPIAKKLVLQTRDKMVFG